MSLSLIFKREKSDLSDDGGAGTRIFYATCSTLISTWGQIVSAKSQRFEKSRFWSTYSRNRGFFSACSDALSTPTKSANTFAHQFSFLFHKRGLRFSLIDTYWLYSRVKLHGAVRSSEDGPKFSPHNPRFARNSTPWWLHGGFLALFELDGRSICTRNSSF